MAAHRADDPRERSDGIGWVSRAIFGDPRLWLDVSAAPPPPGHRVAARYAVVPSVARAKFLLPLASRRVGAASTLAYNALRPPRVRANRLVVGVLAGLGATGLARMPVLTVAVPDGVEETELLLAAHLGRLAGCRLHAAIGIRPPDPHHKPTLQLFDDRGAAHGYAKIGWNDATRAMVAAEAGALRELPRDGRPPPARRRRGARPPPRSAAPPRHAALPGPRPASAGPPAGRCPGRRRTARPSPCRRRAAAAPHRGSARR
ncbi:hypothetical protein [Micromonospora sp. 4G55]|uniref:hypothetical protein n=1 Tax=Micromonospora sp. 4G55 TaxID=2806102 RepID=UPI001A5BB326|nr:hypothetical protein [Micromonospora sp. 4G55]